MSEGPRRTPICAPGWALLTTPLLARGLTECIPSAPGGAKAIGHLREARAGGPDFGPPNIIGAKGRRPSG